MSNEDNSDEAAREFKRLFEEAIPKDSKLFKKPAHPQKDKPSSNWTADLVRIIQECRAENQGMRFSQLMYNLIEKDVIRKGGDSSNENYHSVAFNIHDETVADLVKRYGETGEL